jgi:hypothetical protein
MAIATLSLIHFLDLNWERLLRPGTCLVARVDFHFSSTIAVLATISLMDSLAGTLPLPSGEAHDK